MPVPNTPRLPRTLAREEVYARLRDWIVGGVLPPGEVLRDHDIAAQLGVSRTPVREALRRLEDEGLVETALNRWTRVAPLDLGRAAELYGLVEVLEVLALEQAAPRLTGNFLERLEQANADLARALGERDAARALSADDAFHAVWVEAAGNRTLAEVLGPLKVKLRRVELAYFGHEVRGERSLGEHTAMVDALRAGRWDRAAALLRQNWRGSLERLVAQQGAGADP
ncbi:GntR family transcriptional regulator [Deinococcus planocerae]|uniref:GntR family transcriptional regulator n=1 Tax=Deinococcus planocerae TaxID=1737569 RepID=UPI000C7EC7D6|nr:GntR family transcriptional regulator [Deinococcus planocerae]